MEKRPILHCTFVRVQSLTILIIYLVASFCSQFCVSVSGFKVNDALASSIYEPSFTTPTLHIIGRTDILVIEERSRALVVVSDNARVEEHEGGMYI